MHAAAQLLMGRHDFSSFRAAACQATSPVRTLDRLTVTRAGDEIHLHAGARSFLHNQVRILTGTLKMVGEGRWDAERVAEILAARDRRVAGPTAPPHRSEEHTSELQSLMRTSYAVFCLKKKQ